MEATARQAGSLPTSTRYVTAGKPGPASRVQPYIFGENGEQVLLVPSISSLLCAYGSRIYLKIVNITGTE